MKKTNYQTPELETVRYDVEDVLNTSGGNPTDSQFGTFENDKGGDWLWE